MGTRYTQPQSGIRLNHSNQFVKKLRYCSPLGGNPIDLVSGKIAGIGNGAPTVTSQRGLARGFTSASSQYLLLPTTDLVSGYPLTVACWAKTTPNASGAILYSLNGTTYNAILGYLNATLTVMCSVTQDPSFNRNKTIGTTDWVYLVAVYRATNWALYKNGVLLPDTNILNSAWANPPAGNHSIGNRQGGASLRYNDGAISDLCVFEGELDFWQIQSLTNNPYQIYASDNRHIFSAIVGGGLVGATSTQNNTSGTGAVTQVQILVSSNSSEASTSGTGVIIQTHALASANVSETSTSSTGAVSQSHILVVANSTEDSTSGTGAVTSSSGLVVATNQQYSSSGTGVVMQNQILVGSSCSEDSSSGTGGITQIHLLSSASCSESSTSSTVVISVSGPSLVAANTTQNSLSGTISISQNHVLVGASGVQTSNSSNVVISRGQLLVVASSSQANTSPGASIAIFGNSPSVFSVEVPAHTYGSSVKPRSYKTEKREGKYNGTYRGI